MPRHNDPSRLAHPKIHSLNSRYSFNMLTMAQEAAAARARQPLANLDQMNPVLRCLLIGFKDDDCPLSKLDLNTLRLIYTYVSDFWDEHINRDGVFVSSILTPERNIGNQKRQVGFPAPKDICVNMMPIVMGKLGSVPEYLRDYAGLLHACPAWLAPHEVDKIGYLTIHESRTTSDGESQRRPGLHTETPGAIHSACGAGGEWKDAMHPHSITVRWGGGFATCDPDTGDRDMSSKAKIFHGGIYMASTVAHSTRVWNAQIERPEEVVGALGDIECLRSRLGAGVKLEANELIWMTDTTPHESLPLEPGTYRQYFRLVTSDVSVWYAKHSTPNPIGITPGSGVKIIHDDKFGGGGSASAMVDSVSDGQVDVTMGSALSNVLKKMMCFFV